MMTAPKERWRDERRHICKVLENLRNDATERTQEIGLRGGWGFCCERWRGLRSWELRLL